MDKDAIIIIGGIIGGLASIVQVLMFILPPKYAKRLKPIGRWLNFLANTQKGFKIK